MYNERIGICLGIPAWVLLGIALESTLEFLKNHQMVTLLLIILHALCVSGSI